MNEQHLEPAGETIQPDDLRISKAKETAWAIKTGSYTKLVEVRRTSENNEVVVFETEVERPQKRANDIRRVERIAVEFDREDNLAPEVLALRADFPLVPHLYLRKQEFPRNLCLFDEKYSDLKLDWSARFFIDRIQQWLARTAKGELHQENQLLEPLLLGSECKLVLPHNVPFNKDSLLSILPVKSGNSRFTFIAGRLEDTNSWNNAPEYLATIFTSAPQQHGLIHKTPTNLSELHEFLKNGKIDLLQELKKRLKIWKNDNEKLQFSIGLEYQGILNQPYLAGHICEAFNNHGIILRKSVTIFVRNPSSNWWIVDANNKYIIRNDDKQLNVYREQILGARLVLIVKLPKTRYPDSDVESTELRAFLTDKTIKDIGIELDIWESVEGDIGDVLSPDVNRKGDQISLYPLDPMGSFSRELAAKLSGLTETTDCRITAIGLGALGSQVFMNLIRMGYGKWSLIDDDILLPHNLARHALTKGFIGVPKSVGLALLANQMIEGDPIAESIVADVLNSSEPEEVKEKIAIALRDTNIILDMSTSIAVARYLVHDIDSPARRISLFLNPSGTDVVILAEDVGREVTLDCAEMQYYRMLLSKQELEEHLRMSPNQIRYANSCRDVSNTISQDYVGLLSSICGRVLRKIISTDSADIAIWRIETDEMNVRKYTSDVIPIIQIKEREWTLYTDHYVVEKVYDFRAQKLPNETGGILLGSYDMERKIIYVVEIIPSPPDSTEWPAVYIRGCRGLKRNLDRVDLITAGRLGYVGEWHSHPSGSGSGPSNDDRKAFDWVTDIMSADGLPPLMLIVGDQENYRFYINRMGMVHN